MNAPALAFRVLVRRVGSGPLPFQWQVERDDTLAVVQVSDKRFRSLQEAHEAGYSWLNGFIASRPTPKRPSLSFGARPPRNTNPVADEPLLDLDDDEADKIGADDPVEDLHEAML